MGSTAQTCTDHSTGVLGRPRRERHMRRGEKKGGAATRRFAMSKGSIVGKRYERDARVEGGVAPS